jgi:hypothetical protein
MNLVLHHFRKELAYLRLRWFGFLALLAFELAVNLEWLLPMRAGVPQAAWLAYVPIVVMLAGLSLLLSCPEDRPGSDRSFISTRPMSQRDYWFAHVLAWLLLIVLPVVLQNGLYLALSGRPFAEVLGGMVERFSFAAGFSAWLLPMLVLWQRREMWKTLLILALTLFLASKLLDVIAANNLPFVPSYDQTWPGLVAGWSLFAVVSAVLAWRHLRNGWTFRRRLLMSVLAAVVSLCTARFWVWMTPGIRAQNEALVNELAPKLKVDIDLGDARFDGFENGFRIEGTEIHTGHAGVHVDMILANSEVEQSGRRFTKATDDPVRQRFRSSFYTPQKQVYRGDVNLRDLFPRGTLFVSSSRFPLWSQDGSTHDLATFAEPYPSAEEPLSIQSRFAMDWYQRELALDLPVMAGAHGECEDVRWQILEVKPADALHLGALTISLKMETRGDWDAENGYAMLLHAPDQRLVWLDRASMSALGERSSHTGWTRRVMDIKWNYIFNHADGASTGVQAEKMRFILLRSRFLGRSNWSWQSPSLRLADFPSSWGDQVRWNEERVLYRGREEKFFQERLATLKAPTAQSTEKEVRRYVYDLFSAASISDAVHTTAAHPLIVQAFEPLGRDHLPLMLELRSHTWPGWSNRPPNNQLAGFVTDEQRDSLIDRVIKHPRLADLVIRKGWAEQAKRLKPEILSRDHLPSGLEELLMAWNDDDSNERLFRELKRDLNGYAGGHLDKKPELRPRVEAAIKAEFEKVFPVIGTQNNDQVIAVRHAADFGSSEAFELCLRSMGMGGDLGEQSHTHFFADLFNPDGTEFWKRRMPDHEKWSFFRGLKVSDFEYVPEKRAWRLLKP